MQCPVCENSLAEKTVESITVDVCDGGCGGIWFDNFEFEKVDNSTESAGEGLLEVARDEDITVDHTARRKCPKCGDQIMMRHFASMKREVEVDECPACGGVWLDAGELAAIRAQYEDGEARRAAHRAFAQQLYDEQLAEAREESAPPADDEGEPPGPAEMLRRLFDFL